ncbi:helix-turn-helix domain-containing protein [Rothia terrae]|uniref:Helix-turn-helix domain-containing protein n=1 Tax=Rothia terrae TaxID=396015 RepID=A0A7H2BD09_9MICC|nr:helix-turn-helix domain-containing protein [Rothia terrae]QNV37555.1 helix-turn-helix domain-containing protein [Rothia terrae]
MNLAELETSTKATVTAVDAAELLGVDRRTVSRGIADGTIPSIRVGRRVLIPRVRLLHMLTGQPEPAEQAA